MSRIAYKQEMVEMGGNPNNNEVVVVIAGT